jgi:hypothetical protein
VSADKEVKLTEKQLNEIKSIAVNYWINAESSNTALVKAVIESFIGYCNNNNYVVQDGKVLKKDEKEQEHHK